MVQIQLKDSFFHTFGPEKTNLYKCSSMILFFTLVGPKKIMVQIQFNDSFFHICWPQKSNVCKFSSMVRLLTRLHPTIQATDYSFSQFWVAERYLVSTQFHDSVFHTFGPLKTNLYRFSSMILFSHFWA